MKRMIWWMAMIAMLKLPAWGIPNKITYQGTLKEQGVPANGTRAMVFRLTNSDGSVVYWSSGNLDVVITQGLFSVALAPANVDWQNIVPHIEISVQGQALLPREPVTANAYALMSGTVVNGSITTPKIADGSVTTAKFADGSITAAKLTQGLISTQQLSTGSVTTPIVADGAIVSSKLGGGAVTAGTLAAGSVTNMALQDGSVTMEKLNAAIQGVVVPSGMVAMFTTACPAGWSRFTPLDGLFPMGASAYGATGGSASHSHTVTTDGSHDHGGVTGTPSQTDLGVVFMSGQGSGSRWATWAADNHRHGVAAAGAHNHGGQTGSAGNMPPYVTIVYCQKSSEL